TSVEQEVADVRGVELLLVVQGARSLAQGDAAMLADDVLDDRLLAGHVTLAALVPDEREADLTEIPAALLQHLHQALADQRRDRRALALLPGGEGEPGLLSVGDPSHRGPSVTGRDL